MKKLLFLLPVILLLVSCQPYGNHVTQRFLSQQGRFGILDSVTLDSARQGLVCIDSAHAGNPLIYDSMLKIQPSFLQKVSIAKQDGTFKWALVLFALMLGLVILAIHSSVAPRFKYLPLVYSLAGILAGAGGAAVIDWAHSKEVEIPKSVFVKANATPDGLKPFWDENLFK